MTPAPVHCYPSLMGKNSASECNLGSHFEMKMIWFLRGVTGCMLMYSGSLVGRVGQYERWRRNLTISSILLLGARLNETSQCVSCYQLPLEICPLLFQALKIQMLPSDSDVSCGEKKLTFLWFLKVQYWSFKNVLKLFLKRIMVNIHITALFEC